MEGTFKDVLDTFTEEQNAVVYSLIDQALEDASDEIEFRKEKTFMERTFDLTNCKNCGAPLKRYHCKCEYYGTVYGIIDEWDDVRLFADDKVIARVTSAGIMTVN